MTVRHNFLAWQGTKVGKKRRKIWMIAPLCLFWTLWRERNMTAFENITPSAHRLKTTFCIHYGHGQTCIVWITLIPWSIS